MMKRNPNAFTLVELLAVIIILGMLALVIVPVVDRVNERAREELYTVQKGNIVEAAKNWGAKNFMLLPDKEGEIITITIGQLKLSSFLDKDITNPRTKKKFPNDMELTITRRGNNYDYELLENTGTDEGDIYQDSPVIILNGLAHEISEIHSTYVDKGIIAKAPTGSLLDNYTTVIKSNNIIVDKVDTTKFVQYKITYTVEFEGKTTAAIRTVTVKDTIPPILNIPGNIELTVDEVATFDPMLGVSMSDNSLKIPSVSVSGTISKIKGDYTLTYTATDESGNSTTKSRIIHVYNSPQ